MNLVTVVGHYVSTLKHQLEHYAPYVDDVFVNVHRNSLTDEEYEKVVQITKDFGCGIHKEVEFENLSKNAPVTNFQLLSSQLSTISCIGF